MNLESIQTWFLNLGAQYGVDPVIFGSIYIGAIPFFSLSVAWIVRNVRRGRPITVPVISASFWFVSAYLYLLVAGHGIPPWVYAFIALVIAFGTYSTVRKIQRQTTP